MGGLVSMMLGKGTDACEIWSEHLSPMIQNRPTNN